MDSEFYTVLDKGLARMERKVAREIASIKIEIAEKVKEQEKLLDRLGYARNYLCDRVARSN